MSLPWCRHAVVFCKAFKYIHYLHDFYRFADCGGIATLRTEHTLDCSMCATKYRFEERKDSLQHIISSQNLRRKRLQFHRS